MTTLIILGIFGITVLWMSVYGYVISAKTSEDFMLAGRGLGIVVMFFFMLFTISSAWTFYGYSGFLYLHGPSYVYFVFGCIIGISALYMFLGPRLWAVARINRILSPIELVAKRYDSKVLRFILVILLLGFIIPYIGIQPIGVGLGFKALTGLSPTIGIIYTTILLIVIVLLGGMRTTAWVNVFLGSVYIVAFLGSLIWVTVKLFPGGFPEAAEVLSINAPKLLSAPGPENYFSHLVISGLFIVGMMSFAWPHVVIATLTARDKLIFKWMPLLVIIAGGLMFYSIPFFWGSLIAPAISYLPNTLVPPVIGKEADNILQVIVTTYLPQWFSVFVLMGVIAAAISTAAVQLMTCAIFISRDLVQAFFKPFASDEELVLWTKISIIGIICLSLFIALWNPMALALYLSHIAVPGFAQWAPCLVGSVLWKRGTGKGAIAGVVTGTLILIIGFILNLGSAIIIAAIFINSIVYVIVSLFTKPSSEEICSMFFDEVDDFLRKRV